jgi:uncharacterized protein YwgA
MKVFISWSKDLSKDVAELIKGWLPKVIQSTEVFISTEIEKGTSWRAEIQKQLNETKVGIICVTKRNKNEPWLLFETGAISAYSRKVCTLLIDLSKKDIEQPLSIFNATIIDKDDMWLLIQSINKETEALLPENALKALFDTYWSEFKERFDEIVLKQRLAKESRERFLADLEKGRRRRAK